MTPDLEVDATGLICPLPVLKARKVLAGMASGQVLRLLADDAMAALDVPHFCAESGHDHLGMTVAGGVQAHLIRRA